jgi:predicted RNA methylase
MLRVAGVTQDDTVLDLGCGDGRIVVTAAEEFGAKGLGVELDPALAQAAAEAVQRKGLGDRVHIQQGDVRGLDASRADVITLYLNEKANRQLLDSLKPGTLRDGTRVVSLFFPIQVRWHALGVAELTR